ncbi:hypothetical protein [Acidithiobacillus thiooxidans]|uniref:Uncharacterized protein n=1 Tax=Acidithiobacillus thiooxidans ATCC 19377 TaxID=637390 RepID=A0A5P9XPM5_ACITH|nr:hypothetical protein [Acidithiobacillus thiooxidans]QFX95852.1 hypothetical protein GCD22_01497 [Acidithiobacillus thiooxidans ATCC 19377]
MSNTSNIVLTFAFASLAFCAISVPAMADTSVPTPAKVVTKAHTHVSTKAPTAAPTHPKLAKPTLGETMSQYAPSCVNNQYSQKCKAAWAALHAEAQKS